MKKILLMMLMLGSMFSIIMVDALADEPRYLTNCAECDAPYRYAKLNDEYHSLICTENAEHNRNGRQTRHVIKGDKCVCGMTLQEFKDKKIPYLVPANGENGNYMMCTECNSKVGKPLDKIEALRGDYYISETQHWKQCLGDEKHKFYVEDHDFGRRGICKCGYRLCTACEGTLNLEYFQTTDGKHYKACTANHDHQDYIDYHSYISRYGGACICGAIKCNECGGAVETYYYHTNDGKHYRACVNNHEHKYYVEEHVFDKDGLCICGIKEDGTFREDYVIVNKLRGLNVSTSVSTNKVQQSTIFSDLPTDHWAYAEVKAMVDAGIVNGNGDGTLGVQEKITAEKFIALLSQVIDKKGVAKTEGTSFLANEMMNSTEWSYASYINLTKALGNKSDKNKLLGEQEIKLVLGNSAEQVLENYKKPITREKIASLMGFFVLDDTMTSVNILNATDWDRVNSIYKKRINELVEKEIFRGVSNSDGTITVNPDREISKVEAIALINRLYNTL